MRLRLKRLTAVQRSERLRYVGFGGVIQFFVLFYFVNESVVL